MILAINYSHKKEFGCANCDKFMQDFKQNIAIFVKYDQN